MKRVELHFVTHVHTAACTLWFTLEIGTVDSIVVLSVMYTSVEVWNMERSSCGHCKRGACKSISGDTRSRKTGTVSHDGDDRGTSSDWIATRFLPAVDAAFTAAAIPQEASHEPDQHDRQADEDHNQHSRVSVHHVVTLFSTLLFWLTII